MSAEAKNLRALQEALDAHAQRCSSPPVELRMNPFEVERLGWDEYKGLPIVGDEKMQTGRVRVVCTGEKKGEGEEITEAVAGDEVLV